MLVLGRKIDGILRLTDEDTGAVITLKVIDIQGNRVRLGIDAPSHIIIIRGELEESNERSRD
jgi:carbon storage regulator CsrA